MKGTFGRLIIIPNNDFILILFVIKFASSFPVKDFAKEINIFGANLGLDLRTSRKTLSRN